MKQSTLYILDGTYYVYRAFYAIRGLSTSKGFPTNGLFGFTNMLFDVIKTNQPTYLAVAFDLGENTFRKEIYADYKANRTAMPEELVQQLPYFRKIVHSLRIPVLERAGVEADDVIGSLVRNKIRDGMKVVILTGDKDLYQLVDEQTTLFDSMRNKHVGIKEVISRFQVPPCKVAEVLALSGDKSDNIPGVPGIGERTAGKLVAKFGSFKNVFLNAYKIKGKKRKENLINFKDQAYLSLQLTRIKTDLSFELTVKELELTTPDFEAFSSICTELEFRSFPNKIRKIFADFRPESEEMLSETSSFESKTLEQQESEQQESEQQENHETQIITEQKELLAFVKKAHKSEKIALRFIFETPSQKKLAGVGIATAYHSAYIPFLHIDLFVLKQLNAEDVWKALLPILVDEKVQKLVLSAKDLFALARANEISVSGLVIDLTIAAYLLEPNRLSFPLDRLAEEFLDEEFISFAQLQGTGRTKKRPADVLVSQSASSVGKETIAMLKLVNPLYKALEEQEMFSLFHDLELPLTQILEQMENVGVKIDTQFLASLSEEFALLIKSIEKEIFAQVGHSFNIASSKQLAKVLFEELGLPSGRKNKSGPSTDRKVLDKLLGKNPVIEHILHWKHLRKLTSTYIDAYPKLIDLKTDRIHTHFNQTVAATGRLSSSNPNLQNIPIRTKEGRRIREAFIPRDGWILFGGDYSQIELRLLAHMSEDPVLIAAFKNGDDIHRRTASEVFDVPFDQVSKKQRSTAKAINFGLIYGMGARKLAKTIGVSYKDASLYITRYFQKLSRIKPFFEKIINETRRRRYAVTIVGRRRQIPSLSQKNKRVQAQGERLAKNTPIQGSAADLIKIAMIQVEQALREANLQTQMLIQVHDELLFECPPNELEKAMSLVKNIMENVFSLRVPLRVDMGFGPHWEALK